MPALPPKRSAPFSFSLSCFLSRNVHQKKHKQLIDIVSIRGVLVKTIVQFCAKNGGEIATQSRKLLQLQSLKAFLRFAFPCGRFLRVGAFRFEIFNLKEDSPMLPELAYTECEKVLHTVPSTLGLVGFAAICRMLRISRPTLEKLIADPNEHFPAVFTIGARRYVRFVELQRWVDSKGRVK